MDSGRLRRSRHIGLAAVLLAIAGAGCSQPSRTGAAGRPDEINKGRAFLKLAEIPPRPQFPTGEPAARTEPVEAAARYLKKGQDRFNEQLWAESIASLEKALAIDPSLVEARLLLARAALRHGNGSLAQSHLREVLRVDPRNVAAHQMLGETAWQENRTEEAIASLRLALAASENTPNRPERVLAHLTLAMALRKEGYLSAAVDQLEAYLAATENPTRDMTAYRELGEIIVLYRGKAAGLIGEIQTQLGRLDQAAKAYEVAVAQSPDDGPLRIRLAQAQARAGRADAAMAIVRRIIADAPDDPAGLALLREICDTLKQPQRYDAELIALAKSAHGGALRLQLAELLLKRDKTDAAMEILAAVTAETPDDVKAHSLLARLHLKRGDTPKAFELLAAVLRDHPADFREVESALEAGAGSSTLAESAAALCKNRPRDSAARYLYGCVLRAAGRVDEASQQFEMAAGEEREFGPASAALARILVQRRHWPDAVRAADDAIKNGVTDAEVYMLKGQSHLNLDEYEDGEAALLEAFRQNPKSADALYLLAQAVERRDEKKRCEQLYKRILDDVDPRHIAARERLVLLYIRNDKVDKAKDYLADFDRFGQAGPAVERCRAYMSLATSNEPSGPARIQRFHDDLQKIAEKYPQDGATQIELATACFSVSDFAAAKGPVEAALRIDPFDLRARELKATLLAKLLDYEGSAKVVRELLDERPKDAKYQRTLLDLSLNQADWNTASSLLEKLAAREERKEVKDFLMRQWAECLIIADRADEAVGKAKAWLNDAPGEAARRDAYLSALRAARRFDEAVEQAEKWLGDDAANSDLRAQYINQLVEAKRIVNAQQKVLSWLASDPDDVTLNGLLVFLCWKAKDWDSAVEVAQTGAELSEHRGQYQDWLGRSYVQAKRFDEAVQFYKARSKAVPVRESFLTLVEVLQAAHRYEEAEQTANGVIASQMARKERGEDNDPVTVLEMKRRLAMIYQETDREKASWDAMEEILKLAPLDPGVNNDLGYTWADAGKNLPQAEKMIRMAVAEQPRNSAYLDSLGWALYKTGRNKEALTFLDRAIRMTAYEERTRQRELEDPVLHDHLGDALYRDGQNEKAGAQWKTAKELLDAKDEADDTRELKHLRAKLQTKLKQFDAGRPVDVAVRSEASTTDRPADAALGAR